MSLYRQVTLLQAVENTTAALGAPVVLSKLGKPSAPFAVLGRWRHGPARVEVLPSGAIRVAMSLLSSRNAQAPGVDLSLGQARWASVSVFSPVEGARVEVKSNADVMQLFIDQGAARTLLGSEFSCPPMYNLADDTIRAMIMRLLVESVGQSPDQALCAEEHVHASLMRLQRHANQQPARRPAQLGASRRGLSPTAYNRVEALIAEAVSMGTSLSILQMAQVARLDATYFIRSFQNHTGSTPHRYLVRRRMERAIDLLRDPHNLVGDIAECIGFATPAHFVASFRSAMGVTPAAVRDALSG